MTNAQLTYEQAIALDKFAEADCRLARKEGSILIAQTKVGLVELSYDKASRTYAITCQNGGTFPGGAYKFHQLKLSGCCCRLLAIYNIQIEELAVA